MTYKQVNTDVVPADDIEQAIRAAGRDGITTQALCTALGKRPYQVRTPLKHLLQAGVIEKTTEPGRRARRVNRWFATKKKYKTEAAARRSACHRLLRRIEHYQRIGVLTPTAKDANDGR